MGRGIFVFRQTALLGKGDGRWSRQYKGPYGTEMGAGELNLRATVVVKARSGVGVTALGKEKEKCKLVFWHTHKNTCKCNQAWRYYKKKKMKK